MWLHMICQMNDLFIQTEVFGRAFFKKRAGSRGGAPCRDPQIAKLSKRIKSSGAWAPAIEAPIPK